MKLKNKTSNTKATPTNIGGHIEEINGEKVLVGGKLKIGFKRFGGTRKVSRRRMMQAVRGVGKPYKKPIK